MYLSHYLWELILATYQYSMFKLADTHVCQSLQYLPYLLGYSFYQGKVNSQIMINMDTLQLIKGLSYLPLSTLSPR